MSKEGLPSMMEMTSPPDYLSQVEKQHVSERNAKPQRRSSSRSGNDGGSGDELLPRGCFPRSLGAVIPLLFSHLSGFAIGLLLFFPLMFFYYFSFLLAFMPSSGLYSVRSVVVSWVALMGYTHKATELKTRWLDRETVYVAFWWRYKWTLVFMFPYLLVVLLPMILLRLALACAFMVTSCMFSVMLPSIIGLFLAPQETAKMVRDKARIVCQLALACAWPPLFHVNSREVAKKAKPASPNTLIWTGILTFTGSWMLTIFDVYSDIEFALVMWNTYNTLPPEGLPNDFFAMTLVSIISTGVGLSMVFIEFITVIVLLRELGSRRAFMEYSFLAPSIDAFEAQEGAADKKGSSDGCCSSNALLRVEPLVRMVIFAGEDTPQFIISLLSLGFFMTQEGTEDIWIITAKGIISAVAIGVSFAHVISKFAADGRPYRTFFLLFILGLPLCGGLLSLVFLSANGLLAGSNVCSVRQYITTDRGASVMMNANCQYMQGDLRFVNVPTMEFLELGILSIDAAKQGVTALTLTFEIVENAMLKTVSLPNFEPFILTEWPDSRYIPVTLFITIANNPLLESISMPSLNDHGPKVPVISIQNCSSLVSVNLGTAYQNITMDAASLSGLTKLRFGAMTPQTEAILRLAPATARIDVTIIPPFLTYLIIDSARTRVFSLSGTEGVRSVLLVDRWIHEITVSNTTGLESLTLNGRELVPIQLTDNADLITATYSVIEEHKDAATDPPSSSECAPLHVARNPLLNYLLLPATFPYCSVTLTDLPMLGGRHEFEIKDPSLSAFYATNVGCSGLTVTIWRFYSGNAALVTVHDVPHLADFVMHGLACVTLSIDNAPKLSTLDLSPSISFVSLALRYTGVTGNFSVQADASVFESNWNLMSVTFIMPVDDYYCFDIVTDRIAVTFTDNEQLTSLVLAPSPYFSGIPSLRSLIVSGCPKLQAIPGLATASVDVLDLDGGALTSLDVYEMPYFYAHWTIRAMPQLAVINITLVNSYNDYASSTSGLFVSDCPLLASIDMQTTSRSKKGMPDMELVNLPSLSLIDTHTTTGDTCPYFIRVVFDAVPANLTLTPMVPVSFTLRNSQWTAFNGDMEAMACTNWLGSQSLMFTFTNNTKLASVLMSPPGQPAQTSQYQISVTVEDAPVLTEATLMARTRATLTMHSLKIHRAPLLTNLRAANVTTVMRHLELDGVPMLTNAGLDMGRVSRIGPANTVGATWSPISLVVKNTGLTTWPWTGVDSFSPYVVDISNNTALTNVNMTSADLYLVFNGTATIAHNPALQRIDIGGPLSAATQVCRDLDGIFTCTAEPPTPATFRVCTGSSDMMAWDLSTVVHLPPDLQAHPGLCMEYKVI